MAIPLFAGLRRGLGGVAVALVVSGALHVAAAPGRPSTEVSEAAAAVEALTDGAVRSDQLPDDFAEVIGYQPVNVIGQGLVRPAGTCSVPFGEAPTELLDACRRHDLGYDLLRYADKTGAALAPWARSGIDRRLAADMAAACDDLGCTATRWIFNLAVTANSVRQGYGPPTEEPVLPWVLVLAGAGLAGSNGPILLSRLRT